MAEANEKKKIVSSKAPAVCGCTGQPPSRKRPFLVGDVLAAGATVMAISQMKKMNRDVERDHAVVCHRSGLEKAMRPAERNRRAGSTG